MKLRSLTISVLAVAAMTAGLFARGGVRDIDSVRILPARQNPDSTAVEQPDETAKIEKRDSVNTASDAIVAADSLAADSLTLAAQTEERRTSAPPRMRRRTEPAEGADTAVIFMKADWVTRRQIDTARVTCFVGNFAAHHNGTIITADSAIRYSDSYVECFGNVLINKNTTYVYGDRADYDSEMEIANVYAPIVKMVDGDAKLYSYNFSFDTRDNIGTYYGGGMVINRDNRMESDRGYYFSDYHEVICVERVEMKNDTYEMKGDSVIYNVNTDDAYYFDRSNIWNDKGEYLYADCGEYHRDRELYKVTASGYMLTEKQEVWSDTIDYYRMAEHAILRRNIQIDDTEHQTLGFGDYGEYWGADERAFLTVRPSVVNYDTSQGDTLYMRSDSMFLYTIMVRPDGKEYIKGEPEPVVESESEDESADADANGETEVETETETETETEVEAEAEDDESADENIDDSVRPDEEPAEAVEDAAAADEAEGAEGADAADAAVRPRREGAVPDDMRRRMAERHAQDRTADRPESATRLPRGDAAADRLASDAAERTADERDARTSRPKANEPAAMKDSLGMAVDSLMMTADSLSTDSLTLDSLARELTPEEIKAQQREEAARIKAEKKAEAAKIRKAKLDRIAAARLAKLQEQKAKDEAAAEARRQKMLAAKRKALARENAKRAKKGLPPLEDTLADERPKMAADSLEVMTDSLTVAVDSLGLAVDSLEVMTTDSLTVDSLAAEVPLRDSSYKRVQCYRDVRIYRSDFQALCDSLVAFSSDSTAHLYIRPVLWNGNNQVTSEVMDVFTANQMITKADFIGKPMMIAELDTVNYNQVTGKTMTALFDENGQIYRNDVNGNVETVYYLQDSATGEITDAMYLMSGDATYYIADQQVETITYRTNAEGQLSPLNMLPEDQTTRLDGFEWRGGERPEREDVFDRTIRPSQRERVEALAHPQFPISREIGELMRRLIERGEWLDRVDVLSPEDEEWRRETLEAPYK